MNVGRTDVNADENQIYRRDCIHFKILETILLTPTD